MQEQPRVNGVTGQDLKAGLEGGCLLLVQSLLIGGRYIKDR
jgi:hypothetical protein